ncbi:hypothetical protein NBRC116588_11030 [Pyruvatibacter sp. HU-CL02332]
MAPAGTAGVGNTEHPAANPAHKTVSAKKAKARTKNAPQGQRQRNKVHHVQMPDRQPQMWRSDLRAFQVQKSRGFQRESH